MLLGLYFGVILLSNTSSVNYLHFGLVIMQILLIYFAIFNVSIIFINYNFSKYLSILPGISMFVFSIYYSYGTVSYVAVFTLSFAIFALTFVLLFKDGDV